MRDGEKMKSKIYIGEKKKSKQVLHTNFMRFFLKKQIELIIIFPTIFFKIVYINLHLVICGRRLFNYKLNQLIPNKLCNAM